MVFDSIENYNLYTHINPNFQKAFNFIISNEDNQDGHYILDGEKLIAHVITKDTKLSGTAGLEYHRKYIDIQYVVKGKEICGLSPMKNLNNLEQYDEDNDIAFLDAESDSSMIQVEEGQFYIVWPNEPHRPLCAVDNQSKTIKKIIIKVAVE